MAAAALILTALVVWLNARGVVRLQRPEVAPKPQRQVLRVWVIEGWIGSTAWLEKQGAVFERAHPGVNLRIRRAQAEELMSPGAVPPDVVLFAPGVMDAPDTLLAPLAGALPVRDELAVAGRWRGQQYGVPVAMGGYAMLVNSARIAPSERGILLEETLRAAAKPQKGKQPAQYALACAADGALAYPTALLAVGGALSGGWPQGMLALKQDGVLPKDFVACTPDKAYSDFVSGQVSALLATQREIRKFHALVGAGKGFDAWTQVASQPMTDQLLLCGIVGGQADDARETLCAAWLTQLTGADAQQALTGYGLFPVRGDVAGYDPGEATTLYRMQQVLAGPELLVPNAFDWAAQRESLAARTALALMHGGVAVVTEQGFVP